MGTTRYAVGALIGCVLLAMVGCAGVSATGYAVGDGTYNVLREITNPKAFSPTIPVTWVESCKKEVKVPYGWYESLWRMQGERTDWQDCTRLTTFQFSLHGYGGVSVGTGYISQSGGGAIGSQTITKDQTNTRGGVNQQVR